MLREGISRGDHRGLPGRPRVGIRPSWAELPQSILYDNTKLAVARILGDGRRKRTRAFTELQSHYLFDDRFGRPGKGNDKGKVEGMVGYVRRNFLVPVPSFESFEALNAHLERRCLTRMDARLRGHTESIGQRMERDLEALLPLPAGGLTTPATSGRAGSVPCPWCRYRTNDYSAPVAYGHRDVLVKGYVDRVVISCGARRSSPAITAPTSGMILCSTPSTTCPCWSRRRRALDQAAPLQWMGSSRGVCHAAAPAGVPDGTKGKAGVRPGAPAILSIFQPGRGPRRGSGLPSGLGALSFDAVKHLVLCRLEGRPPRLDLELYPYLPQGAG